MESIYAKSLQSCLALNNSMDCSPPGSPVHGILQPSGVDCHALLQGIFLTHGWNPGMSLFCLLHWQAGFFTTSTSLNCIITVKLSFAKLFLLTSVNNIFVISRIWYLRWRLVFLPLICHILQGSSPPKLRRVEGKRFFLPTSSGIILLLKPPMGKSDLPCISIEPYLVCLSKLLCSVQFSSVAQSCPTLCDPMNCSMPGFPVHHQLLEFTQTHIH